MPAIDTMKSKTKTFAVRASFMLNAVVLLFALVTFGALKAHAFRASIEVASIAVNGGVYAQQERETQMADLGSALPKTALAPPPEKAVPAPAHKPQVR